MVRVHHVRAALDTSVRARRRQVCGYAGRPRDSSPEDPKPGGADEHHSTGAPTTSKSRRQAFGGRVPRAARRSRAVVPGVVAPRAMEMEELPAASTKKKKAIGSWFDMAE